MKSPSKARGLIPTFRRAFSPIARPVLLILLVSLLATLADLPTHVLRAISIPDQPLALMGALIGVVLAFRTNLAYARWWEARTLWGNLASASRTWLRQIKSFVDPSSSLEAQPMQRRLVHLQVAFVHAMSAELRGKEALPEILRFLPPTATSEIVGKGTQVSNSLLILLGRGAAALRRREMVSEVEMRALDLTLTALTDAKGGCERIRSTPFPWEYDGYLQILTYAYCLLLPIAIADETGPLSMIAAPLVGLVLLMLNQIGRNLENPFDHSMDSIPLVSLARELENELLHGIGEPSTAPEATGPEGRQEGTQMLRSSPGRPVE